MWLQREEVERSNGRVSQSVPSGAFPAVDSDEALARLLQEQEQAANRPHSISEPDGGVAPAARQEDDAPRMQLPTCKDGCIPFLNDVMRSGAFMGCCGGLQIASCLGFGQSVTWLCMIGCGLAGQFFNP